MYAGVEDGGWFGSLVPFYGTSGAERALLSGEGSGTGVAAEVVERGHAAMSDWLFQMVFVASTASIVSGTLATCIASGGDPLVQFTGVVVAFVFGSSLLVWRLIDLALGARISPQVEALGQDAAELRIEVFPEFLPQDQDASEWGVAAAARGDRTARPPGA